MTEVTRAQLEALIQPGDGVAVEYVHPDLAQAGIELWSHGRAAHFLCLLGGLDVVEADVSGITRSNLDNYLRGNAVLKFYRCRPDLKTTERAAVRQRWLDQVTNSYGWGSVFRGGSATGIRRFVYPIFPSLARGLLRIVARVVGHQAPDCSALWVDAIKIVRPKVFANHDSEEVTPETIVRSHDPRDLQLIRTLDRPILRKEDR